MILSGLEIRSRRETGQIVIEPWNENQVNPNSYNVTLADELWIYADENLDSRERNDIIQLPKDPGDDYWQLCPGVLYLARTVEYTETHSLVPMIEGRSSVGRLGLFIHVTAGFGDIGFKGFWTLELMCVQPVKIYPGTEIAQIFYHTVCGDYESYSKAGKYQENSGVQASKLWQDFRRNG